jgi:hypothetical protein
MARVLFDGLVEYDDSMGPFPTLQAHKLMTRSYRNSRNNDPNGQRCCDLLELGRRARTRRAEKIRAESCHIILCADCY